MFNVDFGGKSTLIEYKNSNLQYKFYSLYCEENKQCAHVDIDNKYDSTGNFLYLYYDLTEYLLIEYII